MEMEPHKILTDPIDEYTPSVDDGPNEYFVKAWKFTNEFYKQELEYIQNTNFDLVTPEFFFREYTWVVHATGFSAKAVGKFLPRLMKAYGGWEKLSSERFPSAFKRVKKVCNNKQKAKAVYNMAKLMAKHADWNKFKTEQLSKPELLVKLPYIGKITCFHLGRNIGLLDCVKPDLHLIRLANYWEFKSCDLMCRSMQSYYEKLTGNTLPLGIIDLVLWYCSSTHGSLEFRKQGQR